MTATADYVKPANNANNASNSTFMKYFSLPSFIIVGHLCLISCKESGEKLNRESQDSSAQVTQDTLNKTIEPSSKDLQNWLSQSIPSGLKLIDFKHISLIDQATKEGRVSLNISLETTFPQYRLLNREELIEQLETRGISKKDISIYFDPEYTIPAPQLQMPTVRVQTFPPGIRSTETHELIAQLTINGWAFGGANLGSTLPRAWVPEGSFTLEDQAVTTFVNAVSSHRELISKERQILADRAKKLVKFLTANSHYSEKGDGYNISFSISNLKSEAFERGKSGVFSTSDPNNGDVEIFGDAKNVKGYIADSYGKTPISKVSFYGKVTFDDNMSDGIRAHLFLEWESVNMSGGNTLSFDGVKLRSVFEGDGADKKSYSFSPKAQSTPKAINADPKLLVGTWRFPSSLTEYKADGTSLIKWADGQLSKRSWKINDSRFTETAIEPERDKGKIIDYTIIKLTAEEFSVESMDTGETYTAKRIK